jgi:branched-chain amino acid transport system substrate-binding protein
MVKRQLAAISGRWLLLAALALMAALVVAGCGGGGSSSSSGGEQEASTTAEETSPESTESESSESNTAAGKGGEATGEPIKIGAALALSGAFAPYDLEPLKTAKLWVEHVNAEGGINGRPVEFVEADTKSNAQEGPVAAKQVISEGAEIVLVSCDYNAGSPAALAAVSEGVLTFSVCAGSYQFGPQGIGPLAFTIGTPGQTEAAASAEWGIKKMHWKNAYLLTNTSTEFETEFAKAYKETFEHFGGKVLGEKTYKPTETSIANQVADIKSTPGVEVVMVSDYQPTAPSNVRQLRAGGVTATIMGNNGLDGTAWLKQVPNLGEFYFTDYATLEGKDSNPTVNKITKEWEEKYGEQPATSFAYMGWALMEVLQKGIEENGGSTESESLKESLEALNEFETVVGPTTFNEELHISADRTINVNQIVNGEIKFIERIQPTWSPSIVPSE